MEESYDEKDDHTIGILQKKMNDFVKTCKNNDLYEEDNRYLKSVNKKLSNQRESMEKTLFMSN